METQTEPAAADTRIECHHTELTSTGGLKYPEMTSCLWNPSIGNTFKLLLIQSEFKQAQESLRAYVAENRPCLRAQICIYTTVLEVCDTIPDWVRTVLPFAPADDRWNVWPNVLLSRGDTGVFRALDMGWSKDGCDSLGYTLLENCYRRHDVALFEQLLDCGARLDKTWYREDGTEYTMLDDAAGYLAVNKDAGSAPVYFKMQQMHDALVAKMNQKNK